VEEEESVVPGQAPESVEEGLVGRLAAIDADHVHRLPALQDALALLVRARFVGHPQVADADRLDAVLLAIDQARPGAQVAVPLLHCRPAATEKKRKESMFCGTGK
jgi:hypothetical protein